jgi:hypothetical protein
MDEVHYGGEGLHWAVVSMKKNFVIEMSLMFFATLRKVHNVFFY